MVVPAPRRTARVFPRNPVGSALFMILFTAGLYVVEAFDAVTGGALDQQYGIEPLEVDGLDGVLFAPLLHGSLAHLLGNTVPFLVFGFLAMAGGFRQFVVVTATIWILSGIGVWLTGDIGMPPGAESVHIGASGVIFGWLVFLLTRGFFARSALQILMAVGLFLVWGGILLGVLPGQPGVSWQAHLFGALAGLLAARMVARADRAAVVRA
ncbi:MAG TPA: rhomboid family intramembrane serine protease [Pseudonocardia sp.]|uniref:rhomboid family intramembrane serine protease n=1 Tax=Pseudonocardia sp. TaxID=60912 RepID=UPI002B4B8A93|nr:rhomboid family intramembrane serine protease [Pseudonocardia sp.]HLU56990.1 rhomboid family intramembrane serine protease [Pseudonocardia sp.]